MVRPEIPIIEDLAPIVPANFVWYYDTFEKSRNAVTTVETDENYEPIGHGGVSDRKILLLPTKIPIIRNIETHSSIWWVIVQGNNAKNKCGGKNPDYTKKKIYPVELNDFFLSRICDLEGLML